MAMQNFDVIYIDDEPTMTDIFTQFVNFKFKHWRACAFTNSQELYEKIVANEVSAVVWIVDIMMPQKNGIDIAEAIRQENGEKPVVLAYTALDRRVLETESTYQRGLKYFNHFINKKEDFSSILSLVEIWIGQSSQNLAA